MVTKRPSIENNRRRPRLCRLQSSDNTPRLGAEQAASYRRTDSRHWSCCCYDSHLLEEPRLTNCITSKPFASLQGHPSQSLSSEHACELRGWGVWRGFCRLFDEFHRRCSVCWSRRSRRTRKIPSILLKITACATKRNQQVRATCPCTMEPLEWPLCLALQHSPGTHLSDFHHWAPVAEVIGRHVRAGVALHADDTTVPVLAPGLGKTKTGRLWVVVRDERSWGSAVPPAAFYHYSANRKAIHAEALLGTCRGFLHADGYAGFETLYRPTTPDGEPPLVEVACWSHARRKLYEVHHATASPIALEALEQIAALFAIESSIRGRRPDQRVAAREEHARPLLVQLKAFLDTSLNRVSGKSALAQAIRYALSRWKALTRYITDGRLPCSHQRSRRPAARDPRADADRHRRARYRLEHAHGALHARTDRGIKAGDSAQPASQHPGRGARAGHPAGARFLRE